MNQWTRRKDMERRLRKDSKVLWVLKALLVSYVVTGMLLLILAMLLYKFDLDEKSVSAGIIAIYVASTLIGGLVLGKMAKVRRFLWGVGLGIAYFALLLLISLGVYHTLEGNGTNVMTTFILCAGGGMIGGMIS
jgi:putative membrane protein (TIGR04086 family)